MLRKKKEYTIEEWLYLIGWISLGLGLLLMVIWNLWIKDRNLSFPCVFHEVTGLYCPGCGGTRAVVSLLQGNVLRSLYLHPLVPYVALLYLAFMITHTLERLHIAKIKGMRFRTGYLFIAIALVAFQFLEKNILLLLFSVSI